MAFVLGVDLDGVCRDWGGALRKVWQQETGQVVSADDCSSYDLRQVFRHPAADIHEIAFRSHVDQVCGRAPEITGARRALSVLRDEGVRLIAITAHPSVLARYWTLQWLINWGFPFDGVEFTGRGVPKSIVACDLYIDDAPDVVAELQDKGRRVLIFDQPYNRGIEGTRVRDWDEALSLVRAEVAGTQRVLASE